MRWILTWLHAPHSMGFTISNQLFHQLLSSKYCTTEIVLEFLSYTEADLALLPTILFDIELCHIGELNHQPCIIQSIWLLSWFVRLQLSFIWRVSLCFFLFLFLFFLFYLYLFSVPGNTFLVHKPNHAFNLFSNILSTSLYVYRGTENIL